MDEVCTITGARWEMHTKFLSENLNRKDQVQGLDIDGRMILL
jgi:hypothetical protein